LQAETPEEWVTRAEQLIRSGNTQGALDALSQAAAAAPASAESEDKIGFLLAVLGRQSDAIQHFQKSISLDSSYASDVLPGLIALGLGLGIAIGTAMATVTLGVPSEDASVASANVNVMQQIGGAIGIALLSTVAASATSSFAASHATTSHVAAQAAVHGYTTAFTWSAAIFAGGAIICGLLIRPRTPQVKPAAEPLLAH